MFSATLHPFCIEILRPNARERRQSLTDEALLSCQPDLAIISPGCSGTQTIDVDHGWSRRRKVVTHKTMLHCVVSVQEMVLLALLIMVSLGLAQDEGWTPLADIPTPRVYVSSQIVDGKAYVIGGGINDVTNTNIVEEYDIATDTWDTAKTPMPTAHNACSVLQKSQFHGRPSNPLKSRI